MTTTAAVARAAYSIALGVAAGVALRVRTYRAALHEIHAFLHTIERRP